MTPEAPEIPTINRDGSAMLTILPGYAQAGKAT
jgi:hypothetical protein